MLPAIPQIDFCRSTLDVSLEAYPLFGAVQSSVWKRSLYDHGGLSHLRRSFNFRSSLNWLHHTPKNQISRIISMVENSRKNAPFFPFGKTGHYCHFI